MTDNMTLTGVVATVPRHLTTAEGFPMASFRLASNQRRFDRKENAWVDAGTNWYTVAAYRKLATNVLDSVRKGDPVLVTGRLRIRDWESGEKKGINIDLDADTLGHDLSWGKSTFTRVTQAASIAPNDGSDDSFGESDSPAEEFDSSTPTAQDGESSPEAFPAKEGLPVPF